MKGLIKIFLFLFLFFNVFDPADLLFKLKMPLFIICFLIFTIDISLKSNTPFALKNHLFKVLTFIFIPLTSIIFYLILNGGKPFEGFQLFKSYLFFTLSIILYYYRLNLYNSLSKILTILSVSIIFLYFFLTTFPIFLPIITTIGSDYGIFLIGERSYSVDYSTFNIFFVTSPMLVIPISYYVYNFIEKKNIKYFILSLLNILGMYLAGTRNNLFVSLLLPISIYFYYTKNKKVALLFILSILAFGVYQFNDILLILFNSDEKSNMIKLSLIDDYKNIFSNLNNLLFGQGLGSYTFFNTRNSFEFISELTYFELFRNYGIILGLLLVSLLFFPFYFAFNNSKFYKQKYIIIGYAFYLFMCFSNPFLFSSLGILILSIIYSNIYISKSQ
jgi:hypothetical protein